MEEFDWLSLDSDEEIQWKGQPRIKSVIPAVIIGLPLSIFGVGLLIIIGAYLSVKNTYYVVTSNGVYRKKGVLSRDVQKIGFDKIQNISFSQGLFGNYFGYGNVEISTAGGQGVEMRFRSIREPKKVQDLINKRIKTDSSEGEASRDEVLQEILQELREINSKL
ncbi:PH domain-containing protein [Candidatus Nanosalina sp. VS9-1]|uniref:PH domain-containing protein n=1 Tax=Candidatus Nanosalina sp. VS9-1 TaxID=3388566 RepID=UPI0039E144F0